jgi:hypothetical protein
MPSVQQASRPSDFTARTSSRTFSMSRSFGSRQAGAHAEARGTGAPAASRPRARCHGISLLGFDAGVVVRRLRAVGAVLGQPPVLIDSSVETLHVVGDRSARDAPAARGTAGR